MTRDEIGNAYMYFFGLWLDAPYGSELRAIANWHLSYFFSRFEDAK